MTFFDAPDCYGENESDMTAQFVARLAKESLACCSCQPIYSPSQADMFRICNRGQVAFDGLFAYVMAWFMPFGKNKTEPNPTF